MSKQSKVVLVTGGFDPLHSGHIDYFKAAKELGDILVVGLNSDSWLTRKKGQPFMPFTERKTIIENLKMVDRCIAFNDEDDSSIDAIKTIINRYPNSEIIFANGGDRTDKNIPELKVETNNLQFVFGVGGESKKNSSSWILDKWKYPRTDRNWGWYRVLEEKQNYKVKELIIEPNKMLSMQRHIHRSEHWYVLKGKCDIASEFNGDRILITKKENETYTIGQGIWHQCQNNYDEPCHILEVQYGEHCIEEDIERRNA